MSDDTTPLPRGRFRAALLAQLQAQQGPPAPAPPPADVFISHEKPYTFRLNIALMNRLAAYCARTGARKGASLEAALTAWLDGQEGTG